MRIVVAPDSFKECLSSVRVAEVVASALKERFPEAEILSLPLADGGEGTAGVLTRALRGQIRSLEVTGPLGLPVVARYGIAGDTAIIESAEACGLQLLKPQDRNPLLTTTRGVGELLLSLRGFRKLLICLGGTSTCDGGEGMMEVPGLADAMKGVEITVLSDVDNPFVGPKGAARVFAPQKGASPADVEVLEARMIRVAERILHETGTDVSALPGAGAAGGLGGALMAWFGAKMVRGINAVLDALRFDEAIDGASRVITGEGRSDAQTLSGKVPYGVLRRCEGRVPVALLSGRIEDEAALRAAGFSTLVEVTPRDLPLTEALRPSVAAANLRLAVSRLPF